MGAAILLLLAALSHTLSEVRARHASDYSRGKKSSMLRERSFNADDSAVKAAGSSGEGWIHLLEGLNLIANDMVTDKGRIGQDGEGAGGRKGRKDEGEKEGPENAQGANGEDVVGGFTGGTGYTSGLEATTGGSPTRLGTNSEGHSTAGTASEEGTGGVEGGSRGTRTLTATESIANGGTPRRQDGGSPAVTGASNQITGNPKS